MVTPLVPWRGWVLFLASLSLVPRKLRAFELLSGGGSTYACIVARGHPSSSAPLSAAATPSSSSSSSEEPRYSPSHPTFPTKTYGHDAAGARPVKDLMDPDAAMRDFFVSRLEWLPLFRHLMMSNASSTTSTSGSSQARDLLHNMWAGTEDGAAEEGATDLHWDDPVSGTDGSASSSFVSTVPWRRVPAIPTLESDRQILAGFLDAMHQSLLDIPVTDTEHDDENDVQFVEEGRRMLAVSRFQVLSHVLGKGSLDSYDALFAACWSEVAQLVTSAEPHTGSLLLVPQYDLSDLRRFADLNLHRPLEWLGMDQDFEVATLQRQSPALRLLYKLKDIPKETVPPDDS